MVDGVGGSSGTSLAEAAKRAAEEAARQAAEQAAADEGAERALSDRRALVPKPVPADTHETAAPPPVFAGAAAAVVPVAGAGSQTFRVDDGGTLVPGPPPPPPTPPSVRDDWYRDPSFDGSATPSPGVQTMTDRNDARLLSQELGGTKGDQAAFVHAYMALDEAGRGQLMGLMNGTLLKEDSQGHTLVQNLGQMPALSVPAGAPYTGTDILAQTVSHLDDPNTINQSAKNTCGAAIVQYVLAKDQPAEYARLVIGLAGSSGEVRLQSGQTMVRVPDSIDRND